MSKAGSGKLAITNLVVDSVGGGVGAVVGGGVVGGWLLLKVVVLTLLKSGLKGLGVGTNLLYFKVGVGLGGYVTFSVLTVVVASVLAILEFLEPYFFLYLSEKLGFLPRVLGVSFSEKIVKSLI